MGVMKTIRVVAAVIADSLKEKTKVFATQRGYGQYLGWWEFPGGKIEEHESAKEALKREIQEELDIEITLGPYLSTIEYDYPDFHLSMDCYWAEIAKGTPKLLEARQARWLNKDELESVQWLPADLELLDKIKEELA